MMIRWLLVMSLVQVFAACGGEASNAGAEHTLRVQVQGWGDVTPAGGQFSPDSVVTLTASHPVGWSFVGWGGDVPSTDNPMTLTMDGDKSIVATFEQPSPYPNWNETAVRKVLQTFAWGGFPSVDQVALWGAMDPEAAIEEMLTFDPINEKLSPQDFDELGLRIAEHTPEDGGQLEGISSYFATDPDGLLDNPDRRIDFELFSRLSPVFTWTMAIQARGLNTFYHRVGFWETNYHMVASQLMGVGTHPGIRHYDNIMNALSANKPYHEVLAKSALNAAIAYQYGHNYNEWQADMEKFIGNEDFAREFHQLFFGILGDPELLGGEEGLAYKQEHELVSIKNTAKALTGLYAYSHPVPAAPDDVVHVEIDFERESDRHHKDDLVILGKTISGADAREKINALAKEAIDHPESLNNLPVMIVSGLADDNLTPDKVEAIREMWQAADKNLLTFLRRYAISDLFHSADRVKHHSSLDRLIFIRNRMQLGNAELYVGEAGLSPLLWMLDEEEVVPFEPLHNVFGHQTGAEACNSPGHFRTAYNRSSEGVWYFDFGHDPTLLSRDWAPVIPQFGRGQWLVKDVARFLWQRFVADGLKNYGTLERAHLHALLGSDRGDNQGVDLGYYLDEEDPGRIYTREELESEPLLSTVVELGERLVELDSGNPGERLRANYRIQRAIAFIAVTPYAFIEEGR